MHKETDILLEQLQALLKHKKSKQYYADRLGISLEEVDSLMKEINGAKADVYTAEEVGVKHNLDKGTIEITSYYDKAPKPEDIIRDHNIDTQKYKLSNFWSKQKNKGYQVSAYFSSLQEKDSYKQEFVEFLKGFEPSSQTQVKQGRDKNADKNACLIFNKQDAHINKYDIGGDNDMSDRTYTIEYRFERILRKAHISANLNKVIYIIGSDEFNSEHTNATTGGTPQTNMVNYHDGFKRICEHEINMINLILAYSDTAEVIYVPGNHDEYVGWHLITWLSAYFRDHKNVKFDTSPDYTKYIKYYNTGIMLNHGYSVKPERLAQNFPIEFKEYWSSCDHFAIFTGDKHSELTRDIGGIKFYQIPALSKAKSNWDSRNGYVANKSQLTAFLVTEGDGITDIYKETI